MEKPARANAQSAVKLSLIISAYNQRESLDKIFRALAQQEKSPDEILIADDGSDDGTEELIERWKSKISTSIQHLWHPHRGFLKTTILNRAVAMASGDYIVFLDGDCVPHRKFIADHAALAERGFWVQGRRCFVREPFVGEFIPGATPVLQWALRGRIARRAKSIRLPFPIIRRDRGQRGILGCNMAYWREDIFAVNGFDESYQGRGMGADSDLGSRVYNLGRWRKFVYGRALVYHLDHPIAPRPHFDANKARLDEVLHSGKIRAEKGLDQYVKEPVGVV
jgi:glycosyltransferase involved in cell wall biosynthesis